MSTEKNENAYAHGARFSTADTLDEPVMKTIVRFSFYPDGLIIVNNQSFNRAEICSPYTLNLFKFCTLDAQAVVKFSG